MMRWILRTAGLLLVGLIACAGLQAADPQFRVHAINAESTYSSCAVFDVNRDGSVSSSDALQVINRLADDLAAAHNAASSDDDENGSAVDQLLADDSFLGGLF